MYLNMEHNTLKTISSYLFSNNRQKMVISLAHNKLNFEANQLEITATSNKTSPFIHTYNLKLLNLSHNNFKFSFEDWWTNGHDNLDISYNHIRYLWVRKKTTSLYFKTHVINICDDHKKSVDGEGSKLLFLKTREEVDAQAMCLFRLIVLIRTFYPLFWLSGWKSTTISM